MFTGIVEAIGTITVLDKQGDWKASLTCPESWGTLPLGASVSCSGVCLTVIDSDKEYFQVQISTETVSKTNIADWKEGGEVNLERALRMGDELGGHLVTGHVDGLARITRREPEGDSVRFTFEIPQDFARFIAPKGSVALDGISLTVNEVTNTKDGGATFGVNIIPHTQTVTTLGKRQIGDKLNFEVDTIARYVDRMLNPRL